MTGGDHRDLARGLRGNMTDAERMLWKHLRMRQMHGCRFRRQQPIGPYIADFACMETKTIVEVDGGQHSEQVVEDEERTRFLEGEGFRVLRFWNHDVLQQTEAVLRVIEEALSPTIREAEPGWTDPHPHPNLPPSRGKASENMSSPPVGED